jgi:hypothetical protein
MRALQPSLTDSPVSSGGAVTAILIGEASHLDAGGLGSLLEQVGNRPASATIVCVANRPQLIHYWAPMTGLITLDRIRAMGVASASEAARTAAASLPPDIRVQHQVARSWSDALRLVGEHDVIVVSGARRRHQRLLAAARAASTLAGSRASSATPTPASR